MLSERQLGALLRNFEVNLRRGGMEQCNSITMRSGKELEGPRRTEEVRKELELPLEKEKGQNLLRR